MSAEDFGNCYVNRVSADVDKVVQWAETDGADGLKKLAAIAGGGAAAWILKVSGIGEAAEAIAAAVFTAEGAAAAILVLGAASWGALLDGLLHCYDKV
jgi:hypothetical protein